MSTQNIYDLTDTWNNVATTFTAVKMNVTDTASAAGSMLLDLQVGGASQFRVSKGGAVSVGSTIELGHASDTTLSRVSAGVVAIEGVEVTTNTAAQTLSNKTLSSPTLSGTVAGSPSWSGVQTFPDNSKIGDLLGGNGEARLNDDAAFFSWYNGANTVRSGYLQMTAAGGAVLASEISGANLNITTAGAGALQYNSVAIPTISSTDTLSNKTLSGVTIADNTNIVLNTTNGTKIGTATSQKLGFFNATPVVQPTAVADATDAASVITQLNALLTRMRNLGLIAT